MGCNFSTKHKFFIETENGDVEINVKDAVEIVSPTYIYDRLIILYNPKLGKF